MFCEYDVAKKYLGHDYFSRRFTGDTLGVELPSRLFVVLRTLLRQRTLLYTIIIIIVIIMRKKFLN